MKEIPYYSRSSKAWNTINVYDKEAILNTLPDIADVYEIACQMSKQLKDDEEVIKAIMQYNLQALECASDRVRKNKQLALILLDEDFFSWQYSVHPSLREDKEFMLEAVKRNGDNLRFASLECQNNYEILEAAIVQTKGCFTYSKPNYENYPYFQSLAKLLRLEKPNPQASN